METENIFDETENIIEDEVYFDDIGLRWDSFESKIRRFSLMPKFKQKSIEWLKQRRNYLTGSIINDVFKVGKASRRNLIMDKVCNDENVKTLSGTALEWGNKYEPVANAIYSYRTGLTILEFGLITNYKYPHIAISPDGITTKGMLEIKCPYSRQINNKIKPEYFAQVQLQMAICEFDYCDFLECQFSEIATSEEFYNYYQKPDIVKLHYSVNLERGIIIEYGCYQDEDSDIQRFYSPIEYHNKPEQLQQWYNHQINMINSNSNLQYHNTTYWKLDVYSCKPVVRDPQWMKDKYIQIKHCWDEIEYCRTLSTQQLKFYMESTYPIKQSKYAETQETLFGKSSRPASGVCLI